jgi:hypothetical protein
MVAQEIVIDIHNNECEFGVVEAQNDEEENPDEDNDQMATHP